MAADFSTVGCGRDAPCPGKKLEVDIAPGNDGGMGPDQALTMPHWMEVDRSAGTATLEVVAGKTDANNYWNFNGYHYGNAHVVVPQGTEVTINFSNMDQLSPHSLGIDARTSDFPTIIQEIEPVFEGA